jgi:hypothetical protein
VRVWSTPLGHLDRSSSRQLKPPYGRSHCTSNVRCSGGWCAAVCTSALLGDLPTAALAAGLSAATQQALPGEAAVLRKVVHMRSSGLCAGAASLVGQCLQLCNKANTLYDSVSFAASGGARQVRVRPAFFRHLWLPDADAADPTDSIVRMATGETQVTTCRGSRLRARLHDTTAAVTARSTLAASLISVGA